ncbi:polyphosphate kinase 1 [Mucilaginibacter paludis]|uniref:Polyphosphate kinase n=1 Tax=Mucilaginibacter paludis DSM 18603 TaxID=714943 RepID=H1YB87_9SPHI|nr:polyphosphate kinase 1 [Mucilaginibacter paludis]EHQ30613.1 polyphosphate kinase 1 [Mucilaginibacter paludis DSM 18603]
MEPYRFFNRDLSWLHFNAQVMEQAANNEVPLLDRIKFLGIFSSNLDEFYRVRMPVLRALHKIGIGDSSVIDGNERALILQQIRDIIDAQQSRFGQILTTQIIPSLKAQNIHLVYNEPIPDFLNQSVREYFTTQVLAFMQPVWLGTKKPFFPENNKLYFMVHLANQENQEEMVLLNIPSDSMPRFYTLKHQEQLFVVFLDDVIRFNLDSLFKDKLIKGCYSFKVTRDAELDLKDEYSGDLSAEIEEQLSKRDFGLATRFLHQAGIPLRTVQYVSEQLDLGNATKTTGGSYHNLKDFSSFPANFPGLSYQAWQPLKSSEITEAETLVSLINKKDLIVHTPYQSYHTILRFFNEAAINPDVEEINVTLYRVASNSLIVNALISAAKNGKNVNVVVELKARFDEANNLKWAKKMKDAGVKITYSVTANKVHAKIAFIKIKNGSRRQYAGLLATGNFNETTAQFYTDHILLTANTNLLREMELLFLFLVKREKPSLSNHINFNHILVAQFNMQTRFIELIDREIDYAKQGLPAQITLKMNNLEERVLISKLYEASQAGVKVALIIRSICCLIPGVKGMSENITVKRIVDRYLEHGRVFIFNNNGEPEMFLGSADWMNRNIYHRIEVCFPVYNEAINAEMTGIINLQLKDNVQAVSLNEKLENVKIERADETVQSQSQIYQLLKNKVE